MSTEQRGSRNQRTSRAAAARVCNTTYVWQHLKLMRPADKAAIRLACLRVRMDTVTRLNLEGQ